MPTLVKELDGFYTRMLSTVLNVNWKHHTTNAELYGELSKLNKKIKEGTRRLATPVGVIRKWHQSSSTGS